MFRSLLYSHLQSEPLKSVIYQSSFNCNYLIKSCVRLCNCIYSIFYWTQRGCLTWKWFQKRASSKYHKNRILTGNHTANYSNLPTFVFFLWVPTGGPGSPHFRGFTTTHTHITLGSFLWTSDGLVAETSTWQRTTLTIPPIGIRTRTHSKQVTAEWRLRQSAHWHQYVWSYRPFKCGFFFFTSEFKFV